MLTNQAIFNTKQNNDFCVCKAHYWAGAELWKDVGMFLQLGCKRAEHWECFWNVSITEGPELQNKSVIQVQWEICWEAPEGLNCGEKLTEFSYELSKWTNSPSHHPGVDTNCRNLGVLHTSQGGDELPIHPCRQHPRGKVSGWSCLGVFILMVVLWPAWSGRGNRWVLAVFPGSGMCRVWKMLEVWNGKWWIPSHSGQLGTALVCKEQMS